MRLSFTLFLATAAIVIGWLTEEYWFGIGLFIGGMVSFWIVYEEKPANWDHLTGNGETSSPSSDGSGKKKGSHLLNFALCVLGMAWLLGKDDEEE